MPEAATPVDNLEAIAGRLLNQDILAAVPVAGGGNNRVYRIAAEAGPYALKFYPPQDEDRRDRLGQEFSALEFMTANGIDCVPKPIAADKDLCCGVFEWVDGAPFGQADGNDIDAMTALAATLAELSGAPGAQDLTPASAHCFSGNAVIEQLNQRFQRLQEAGQGNDTLNRFLDEGFCPRLDALADRAKGFEDDLAPRHRTLSPSDFGFHNALKQNTGKIVFLDFEYFGWDDPVKMVSDVLWHPGSNLTPALGDKFQKNAGEIFAAGDDGFKDRLDALYPLYGMIWCLTLLNEFLPERWHRRISAGTTTDADQAQAEQLQAAKDLLNKIDHE
jgi:hypothetical protein